MNKMSLFSKLEQSLQFAGRCRENIAVIAIDWWKEKDRRHFLTTETLLCSYEVMVIYAIL